MGIIYKTRVVEEPDLYFYTPEYNEDGSEKHIYCNDARYHVLSWSTQGTHCSEKRCEINAIINKEGV